MNGQWKPWTKSKIQCNNQMRAGVGNAVLNITFSIWNGREENHTQPNHRKLILRLLSGEPCFVIELAGVRESIWTIHGHRNDALAISEIPESCAHVSPKDTNKCHTSATPITAADWQQSTQKTTPLHMQRTAWIETPLHATFTCDDYHRCTERKSSSTFTCSPKTIAFDLQRSGEWRDMMCRWNAPKKNTT